MQQKKPKNDEVHARAVTRAVWEGLVEGSLTPLPPGGGGAPPGLDVTEGGSGRGPDPLKTEGGGVRVPPTYRFHAGLTSSPGPCTKKIPREESAI